MTNEERRRVEDDITLWSKSCKGIAQARCICVRKVKRLAKQVKTEGAVERKVGSGRPKSAATAESIKKVSETVKQNTSNGYCSVRKIAAERKLSKRSAFRIMEDEIATTPLRRIGTQELKVQDEAKRIAEASQWLRQIEAGELDVRKVIFSDEET